MRYRSRGAYDGYGKAGAGCDAVDYNPSNIFARARLVQTRHVTEYSPVKTGEYPRLIDTKTVDSVDGAR